MTAEDKQLLLKDICARLPYKPMIRLDFQPGHGYQEGKMEIRNFENIIRHFENGIIATIKPYLRPMSSMTSKEWVEFCDCSAKDEASWVMTENRQKFIPFQNREDYLNSKHFDHRGLIPMGLALEALPGMYKTK